MPKLKTQFELIPLLKSYINDLKKGRLLQKNGKIVRKSSIENYGYLLKLLDGFQLKRKFPLEVRLIGHRKSDFLFEQKYWSKFYIQFTDYMYNDVGCYDNYVGAMIKLLRAFFKNLTDRKGMNIGFFYRDFYIPNEEINIIVLSPERLHYVIHSAELDNKCDAKLKIIKDIFCFGSIVALRYSDLINLTKANIERVENNIYIKNLSKKTNTYTRVKLPKFAVEILAKYSLSSKKYIFPQFNKAYMNKKIKLIMELAGFTEEVIKTKNIRGLPVEVLKNNKTKEKYRYCDLISTHTMRRTAITTMLSLGMNEYLVRKISGHAANSKEFYRYVSFAQTFLDKEIDKVHQTLDRSMV